MYACKCTCTYRTHAYAPFVHKGRRNRGEVPFGSKHQPLRVCAPNVFLTNLFATPSLNLPKNRDDLAILRVTALRCVFLLRRLSKSTNPWECDAAAHFHLAVLFINAKMLVWGCVQRWFLGGSGARFARPHFQGRKAGKPWKPSSRCVTL